MWQFARAVEGISAACRALDIPITGGNVSLYNETDGRGILPTPVLGVVGVIDDPSHTVRRAFVGDGDAVVLLGTTREELGGSEYLKVLHGIVRGAPPVLDLEAEAALQQLLVSGAAKGLIRSAHDCAEGGCAVTVAECCFDTGLGATVDIPALAPSATAFSRIAALFGESASRVIVSVSAGHAAELTRLAAEHGVPAAAIGRVGGTRIRISLDGTVAIDEPLGDAERIWAGAIGRYFESERAIA
jgi:phosphoribosylformylglycinamidine synthase